MKTPRTAGIGLRRVAALALVVVLGSGGLLLAAPPTGAADPPTGVTVTGGWADWGVRSSFRSYITGPIAQGSISTADGATTNADGTFNFPDASGTSEVAGVEAAFGGSVHFTGHDGALEMTISDLRVVLDADTGVLQADVESKSFETGEPTSFPDVTFATLDLNGIEATEDADVFTWTDIPALLTQDGSEAFAEFYPAGTALDPLDLTLAFGDTTPSTPSTPTTADTSSSTGSTATSSSTTTVPSTETPSGTRTGTGPEGQVLTVTPADHLDPAGTTVSVTGSGYDDTIGVYLAFCVDNGPGVAPSPCLGGVDMEGSSGASVWISSNPPPYGVGIAHPFGAGSTFDEDITVAATDRDDEGNIIADCLDGTTKCVVTTRADHTNASVRTADVKVPVYFAGQTIPDDTTDEPSAAPWVTVQPSIVRPGDTVTVTGGGFAAGEQVEIWLHSDPQWVATATADSAGGITQSFVFPDVPPGEHSIELRSISGTSVMSASFTVLATAPASTTNATGQLPVTGAQLGGVTMLGLGLVAGGIALAGLARTRQR